MVNIVPSEGQLEFSYADKVVAFAESNDMKIRFHPLIMGADLTRGITIGEDWHPTSPWIHNGDFNREEMIAILYDYFEAVMNRYGNRIHEWVVVNEPIWWGSEGGLKNSVWKDRIGEDYIELAFRKARELAPNVVLILNEFGVDYVGQRKYSTQREEDFYNLVKGLVDKGVPIDAVGFEFHLKIPERRSVTEPTVDKIVANFERYGDLGLDVMVTELDVAIEEPITQEKLERQAEVYAIVMEAVLKSDSRSISVWGQSDRYSWITYSKYHWPNLPDQFPGYSAACMYDENHEPKPAYYAVLEVMRKYLR